jgi:hypothetical protein
MYSHFGVSQSLQHQSLKKLLFQLRDNDTVGFVIPVDDMPAAVDLDPSNFIVKMANQTLKERCFNYTLHNCQKVLDHRTNTNEAPSTLSQDFLNFNDNSGDGDCQSGQTGTVGNGDDERLSPNEAFEYINPRIKSLLSVIQSTGLTRSDLKDLKELNKDFLQMEEKFLEMMSTRKRQSSSAMSSQFVSSNLPDHNRRKTHGTKHMRHS